MIAPPRVRILHETNPRKYFPALYALHEQGRIKLTGEHRISVCKEWLRAGLRDRAPLKHRTRNALADARFRAIQHRIKDEIVVMGFAPWDTRLLWYQGLAARNRVVYHTSWPDWRPHNTPRQPPLIGSFMRRRWRRFLAHPNVTSVAVLDAVADALTTQMQTPSQVIPHAVPDLFFAQSPARKAAPLRLLFVGELSEKKGLPQALALIERFPADSASLTVIGRGPLEGRLPERVRYLGALDDRAALAHEMASHDVLLCLSQRTATWQELFGIVIAEALASGCGVIASNHTGPSAILGDAPGLVDEHDQSHVAAMLQEFITNPSKLATFRAAQTPRAAPFALPQVAARWDALFQDLADG